MVKYQSYLLAPQLESHQTELKIGDSLSVTTNIIFKNGLQSHNFFANLPASISPEPKPPENVYMTRKPVQNYDVIDRHGSRGSAKKK